MFIALAISLADCYRDSCDLGQPLNPETMAHLTPIAIYHTARRDTRLRL